jgi:hypothetical protein
MAYTRPERALSDEERQWREKDPMIREALAGKVKTGRVISPVDKVEVIASRVPVREVGWVAGASRPYGPLMRTLVWALVRDLVIVVGIAAVSALLALGIGHRITRPLDRLRAVQAILRLEETVGPQRLEAACGRALYFGDVRYRRIKQILNSALDQEPLPEAAPRLAQRSFAFARSGADFFVSVEGRER